MGKRQGESAAFGNKMDKFYKETTKGDLPLKDEIVKADTALQTARLIAIGEKLNKNQFLTDDELDVLGVRPETLEMYREFLRDTAPEINKSPNKILEGYLDKRLSEVKIGKAELMVAPKPDAGVEKIRTESTVFDPLLEKISGYLDSISDEKGDIDVYKLEDKIEPIIRILYISYYDNIQEMSKRERIGLLKSRYILDKDKFKKFILRGLLKRNTDKKLEKEISEFIEKSSREDAIAKNFDDLPSVKHRNQGGDY